MGAKGEDVEGLEEEEGIVFSSLNLVLRKIGLCNGFNVHCLSLPRLLRTK